MQYAPLLVSAAAGAPFVLLQGSVLPLSYMFHRTLTYCCVACAVVCRCIPSHAASPGRECIPNRRDSWVRYSMDLLRLLPFFTLLDGLAAPTAHIHLDRVCCVRARVCARVGSIFANMVVHTYDTWYACAHRAATAGTPTAKNPPRSRLRTRGSASHRAPRTCRATGRATVLAQANTTKACPTRSWWPFLADSYCTCGAESLQSYPHPNTFNTSNDAFFST